MIRRTFVIVVCLVATAGCDRQPAKPSAPVIAPPVAKKFVEVPETPPTLASVTYRPEFSVGGTLLRAGTAFVIRSKAGDKYLLTAAHLLTPPQWANTRQVALIDFKGVFKGSSTDKPIYLGKGMDPASNETEFDLVIFKLGPDDKTVPLTLAVEYPNQNRLWVVGSEVSSKDGLQKTFELNPASSIPGKNTVLLNKPAPFNLQAFSGGPIVDHEGKVVATLLGGNDASVIGTSVASLRQRLTEKGIQPE